MIKIANIMVNSLGVYISPEIATEFDVVVISQKIYPPNRSEVYDKR